MRKTEKKKKKKKKRKKRRKMAEKRDTNMLNKQKSGVFV